MNYSITEINRDYLIKVYGIDMAGNKVNKLVGVSGLINLIGYEFACKFINKAFDKATDICKFKLRRGIQVTFYLH